MRKDPSTFNDSEFIQGGSLDDSVNTVPSSTNVNSLDNLTIGDSDRHMTKPLSSSSSTTTIARSSADSHKVEERDEKPLLGDDQVEDSDSVPDLHCLSSSSESSHSETTEGPSATLAVAVSAETKPKKTKSLRFSHCSIRSYNQILGDHPECSAGCPIALGWKVIHEETFEVDDFETIREPLRKKKGVKSPTQLRRKKRVSSGDEHVATSRPSPKYVNAQLKLSAQERRERLRDYSDGQIRKEWSRIHKQSRRALIKEGLRQFRMVGMHYAGY